MRDGQFCAESDLIQQALSCLDSEINYKMVEWWKSRFSPPRDNEPRAASEDGNADPAVHTEGTTAFLQRRTEN
jgi:hypothetical protein